MKYGTREILGMDLEIWTHESCEASFGVGPDWATLYSIESQEKNKGHAQTLLIEAMAYYEGKKIGGTMALNPIMKYIYKKLGILEYTVGV